MTRGRLVAIAERAAEVAAARGAARCLSRCPIACRVRLPPDVHGDGRHRRHLRRRASRPPGRARPTGGPRGRSSDLRSLLVTFDPHPLEVVNPPRPPLLLTVGARSSRCSPSAASTTSRSLPFTRRSRVCRPRSSCRWCCATGSGCAAAHRPRPRLRPRPRRRRRGAAGARRARGFASRSCRRCRTATATDLVDRDPARGRRRRSRARGARARPPVSRRRAGRRGEQRGRLLGFPTLNVALPSAAKLLPPEGRLRRPGADPRRRLRRDAQPRPAADVRRRGDRARGAPVRRRAATGTARGFGVDFVARLRDTRRFRRRRGARRAACGATRRRRTRCDV